MKNFLSKILKSPESLELEIYTDKLDESAQKLYRSSYEHAKHYHNDKLIPEHLLIAFANLYPAFFEALVDSLGLDSKLIIEELSARLEQANNSYSRGIRDETRGVMSNALKHARSHGRNSMEAIDLMIGIFMDKESYPVKLFNKLGAEEEEVVRRIEMLRNQQKL